MEVIKNLWAGFTLRKTNLNLVEDLNYRSVRFDQKSQKFNSQIQLNYRILWTKRTDSKSQIEEIGENEKESRKLIKNVIFSLLCALEEPHYHFLSEKYKIVPFFNIKA